MAWPISNIIASNFLCMRGVSGKRMGGCFKNFLVTTPLVYNYAKIWKHFCEKSLFTRIYIYINTGSIYLSKIFLKVTPGGLRPPGPPWPHALTTRAYILAFHTYIFPIFKFVIHISMRNFTNFEDINTIFFVHEGGTCREEGVLQKFFDHISIL